MPTKKLSKVRVRTKTDRPPNMLFPGLPRYQGPDKGWFAWVHHGKLFEHTSDDGDSIANRVDYVQRHKPKDEKRIRLAHIMFLGNYVGRKLTTRSGKCLCSIQNDPEAKAMVYRYIAKHKPNNRWAKDRGRDGTLLCADGTPMTG